MSTESRAKLQETVIHPIKPYLLDTEVNEIMVNETGTVIIEHGNELLNTKMSLNKRQIETIIRIVASSNGITVNPQTPSFSAEMLPYRYRFQGIIPPASTQPVFCIRKKRGYSLTLETLVTQNTLTRKQMLFLQNSVQNKKNILVAGGTGSGKTTLVNALLSDKTVESERIIVIEDTPELYLNPQHGFRLLARKGYSYTEAIKDVLRMRPDRIVIGELRDSAALDLLKAWNTGHGGGISTIHSNSATTALERLAQLIEERVETAPRIFIADVVDICVYIRRVGMKRKVSEIKQVKSYINNSFITKEVL